MGMDAQEKIQYCTAEASALQPWHRRNSGAPSGAPQAYQPGGIVLEVGGDVEVPRLQEVLQGGNLEAELLVALGFSRLGAEGLGEQLDH